MTQTQLFTGDWHITHCPMYHEKFDRCASKTFNNFTHCGSCPVRNRPQPKKRNVKVNSCKRNQYSPGCDTCTDHIRRGNFNCKSCKKLTVKSKLERDTRRINRRKGNISHQRNTQNWMEWKEKENFDKIYEKSEE